MSDRRRSVKRLVRLTLGLDVLIFLIWSVVFILYSFSVTGNATPLQIVFLVTGLALIPGVLVASIWDWLPPLRPLVWPSCVAYSIASSLVWFGLRTGATPTDTSVILVGAAFYTVGVAASMAAHVLDGGRSPTNLDRLCGDLVGERRG